MSTRPAIGERLAESAAFGASSPRAQLHGAVPGPDRSHSAVTEERNPLRWLLLQGLLAGLWLLAFEAARLLEYAPHASLWFPPAAVSFAGILVFRWRALPGLLLACLTATMLVNADYQLGLGLPARLFNGLVFATVHCLAYGLAAALVLISIDRQAPSAMPRSVSALLFGGLLGAALAALGGATVTWLGGMIPALDARLIIVPWLIGDYAGLLALGPLLALGLRRIAAALGWSSARKLVAFDGLPSLPARSRIFTAKLALLLGLTALVMLAAASVRDYPPILFTVFLAVVLQLWIVHTEGALQALIALGVFSVAVAVLTAALDLGAAAFTLQFAVITLAGSTYFGLAVPMLYADNARLRQMVTHDALTGAFSRRFFEELVSDQLTQARSAGRCAALVMIDLDHLKTMNDRHGHAAGDALLTDFVACCRRELGAGDLIGRIGGDEFCVYLAGADRQNALGTAERIATAFAASGRSDRSTPLRGVSLGVAEWRDEDDGYAAVLARADAALYQSKRSGRGRASAA
jgi:diguanylate cyclase (GGDEF)-like protein